MFWLMQDALWAELCMAEDTPGTTEAGVALAPHFLQLLGAPGLDCSSSLSDALARLGTQV